VSSGVTIDRSIVDVGAQLSEPLESSADVTCDEDSGIRIYSPAKP
jgi:hypothetical protein